MSPGNLSPKELPLLRPLSLTTVLSSVLFRPDAALFWCPATAAWRYDGEYGFEGWKLDCDGLAEDGGVG
jgi:hypothetical protein